MNKENIENKIRVLVVDDSLLIHKLIKRTVENEGYEVIATAINGKQAVEMFEQHRPDIVTMDVTMPVMNGIEATELIRKIDPNANIIFFGSAIDKNILEKATELGVKYFIDKPFEKEKLLNVINAAVTGEELENLPKQSDKREINNIILPFFRALEEVMDCMVEAQGKVEVVEESSKSSIPEGYSTVLGFIGKINGWVVLNMSKDTARIISERVNRETFEDQDDAFIGFSIQELGNIICGSAIKKINNTDRNLNIRLTPPGLFKGNSVSLLGYSNEKYEGIFRTDFGNVHISIIFE